jgi:hypothetical protein
LRLEDELDLELETTSRRVGSRCVVGEAKGRGDPPEDVGVGEVTFVWRSSPKDQLVFDVE